MSCRSCGTDLTNLDLCVNCKQVDALREQVTVLKAERDEAVRTRDEVHHELMELLARIHRDGGHYADTHGVEKAVEDAHDVIVAMHVKLDRLPTSTPAPLDPYVRTEEHPSGKNRMELARYRAGLSAQQAADMLQISRDELIAFERADEIDSRWNRALFAAVYGVSVEWLTGQVPRYNYDAIKDIPGYDELSPHDRDTVAEFTASLPPHLQRKKK